MNSRDQGQEHLSALIDVINSLQQRYGATLFHPCWVRKDIRWKEHFLNGMEAQLGPLYAQILAQQSKEDEMKGSLQTERCEFTLQFISWSNLFQYFSYIQKAFMLYICSWSCQIDGRSENFFCVHVEPDSVQYSSPQTSGCLHWHPFRGKYSRYYLRQIIPISHRKRSWVYTVVVSEFDGISAYVK